MSRNSWKDRELTSNAVLGCIVGALVGGGHKRVHGAGVDDAAPSVMSTESVIDTAVHACT